jgi:hypothetical protein
MIFAGIMRGAVMPGSGFSEATKTMLLRPINMDTPKPNSEYRRPIADAEV